MTHICPFKTRVVTDTGSQQTTKAHNNTELNAYRLFALATGADYFRQFLFQSRTVRLRDEMSLWDFANVNVGIIHLYYQWCAISQHCSEKMECTHGRKWLQTPPLGKVFDSSIPKNTTTFSYQLQRRLASPFLVPVERLETWGFSHIKVTEECLQMLFTVSSALMRNCAVIKRIPTLYPGPNTNVA